MWPLRFVSASVLSLVLAALLPFGAAGQHFDLSHVDDEELVERLIEVDDLRAEGDFRNAFTKLGGLENDYPEHAEVLWRLSATIVNIAERQDQGRRSLFEQGLDAAKRAIEADDTNGLAHFSRAMAEGRLALDAGTREQIERSRAVKHHADRAIELDENNEIDGAYHARGQWHREVASLGRVSRAVVRTVYGGLPDASFDEAVDDFLAAIDIDDRILHRIELARTYKMMDEPEKAREQLEILLDMPSEEPDDESHKSEAREMLDDL